jgi:hypothetical protein
MEMILNGLHGVISQKIGIFITTGVRTSNPTGKSLPCPDSSFNQKLLWNLFQVLIFLSVSFNELLREIFGPKEVWRKLHD